MIDKLITFLKERDLGACEQGVITLKRAPQPLSEMPEVRKRIEAFMPAEGWISYTDAVEVIKTDSKIQADKYVIAAELAKGAHSLHVRQSGRGWTATELTRESGEGVVVIDTFIAREDKVPGARMRYETCWQERESPVQGGAKAFQSVASRFAGFVKEVE